MIRVTLNEENVQRAEVLMKSCPKIVQRAAVNAINRAITSTRAEISKAVRGRYAVKAADVKKALSLTRAKGQSPRGVIVDFQYEILSHPFLQNKEDELSDIQKVDLLLGGGTGFLSKTLVYALAPRREDAVYVTRKLMEASFRNGKHFRDKVISPHTLKLVRVGDNCYLMGLCYLEGEEIRC